MNEQSTSAPAPSRHVFLHELSKQSTGAKVRLLCCVFEYDATKGQVHVEHAYPVTMTPTPRAVIDVNLVLETFQGDMLENGRWINVIGYVKGRQQTQETSTGRSLEADLPHLLEIVLVQAVLVWDAGAMRVDEYEKTVEAQREVWRKTRHLHENMKEGRSR